VGLPTHTTKKPFSRLSKARFWDIFVPWDFFSVGKIFGAFHEAPRSAEKLGLFFVSPTHISVFQGTNERQTDWLNSRKHKKSYLFQNLPRQI
jgi:hypothetical protein